MRVATFLSAATIAALMTVGPALAYGPATSSPSLSYLSGGPGKALSAVAKEQTKVAFVIIKHGTYGYVYVRGDNGQQIRNCDTRANCTDNDNEIEVFQSNHPEASIIHINCFEVGGCIIVGKS
jgi:hypothetical protein